jgi:hypothetical protein
MPHPPSSNIGDHLNLLYRADAQSGDSSGESSRASTPDEQFWRGLLRQDIDRTSVSFVGDDYSPGYYSPLDSYASVRSDTATGYFDQAPAPAPTAMATQLNLRSAAPSPGPRPGTPTIRIVPPPEAPMPPPQGVLLPTYRVPRPTSRQRALDRHNVLHYPLADTPAGRSLQDLRHRTWFRLTNGMCVTRLGNDEPGWRVQDIGNKINWLGCGAWSHRSVVSRCVAVLHIEALNLRLVESGVRPIVPIEHPPGWIQSMRVRPVFLRDNFYSSALRLNPEMVIAMNTQQEDDDDDA